MTSISWFSPSIHWCKSLGCTCSEGDPDILQIIVFSKEEGKLAVVLASGQEKCDAMECPYV
jgi:hypothetical protein